MSDDCDNVLPESGSNVVALEKERLAVVPGCRENRGNGVAGDPALTLASQIASNSNCLTLK